MIFKAEPAGGKKGSEEVNGTKEETEALKSAAWKTALKCTNCFFMISQKLNNKSHFGFMYETNDWPKDNSLVGSKLGYLFTPAWL